MYIKGGPPKRFLRFIFVILTAFMNQFKRNLQTMNLLIGHLLSYNIAIIGRHANRQCFSISPTRFRSLFQLTKRKERRDEALKEHDKAVEEGDTAMVDKFSRRLVKVTKEHTEECKMLLRLMGAYTLSLAKRAERVCGFV